MGEWFGCCGKYEKCSDALKCLDPDPEYGKRCYYKQNLDQGKVFYGKNRNIDINGNLIKKESIEIFVHCFDRLFCVKIRHKMGWSYNLTKDQFEMVKTVFDAYSVPYKTECSDSECIIDTPTQEDPSPSNSRVYFKIDDMEFNLYHANGYMMKYWRAEKIAKSLTAKGFEARAETVGRYSNVQKVDLPEEVKLVEVKTEIKQVEVKAVEVPVEQKEPEKIKSDEKPRYKQMSLFDFERVS